MTLCSYSGDAIPLLGSIDTKVRYKVQRACLTLLVVRGTGSNLVGRNGSKTLRLIGQIHIVLSREYTENTAKV